MFQFRRFPTYDYFIHRMLTDSSSAGFPHSEIHGSMAAFASPWLIVDRYVLRRLLVPRHSPYALSSLTIFYSRSTLCLTEYPSRKFTTHFSLCWDLRWWKRVNNPCSNHLVHLWISFKIRVSLDDKIIVVFTLKYFYHFTFTIALCSVFKVHFTHAVQIACRYILPACFRCTLSLCSIQVLHPLTSKSAWISYLNLC